MFDEQLAARLASLSEFADYVNTNGVAPSIVCPRCQRRSHNPKDIKERYCGHCHDWHPSEYTVFNRPIVERGPMHDGVQELTLECRHVVTCQFAISDKRTEMFCVACEADWKAVLKSRAGREEGDADDEEEDPAEEEVEDDDC